MNPPDKRILHLVLLAVAVMVAWWLSRLAFADTLVREPFVSLESAFYYQPNIVYVPKYQVLGTEVDETLYNIIRCESGFEPTICNAKYGCGSGIGLGQLTAVAIADCEKTLSKIDPYNAQENLECSLWLYEKHGTAPWGTATSSWGSYYCWNK